MAKREKLEFEATFTDRASQPVDQLTEKVDNLDGKKAEVEVSADDKASADIEKVSDATTRLDSQDAEVELTAQDKATAEVEEVRGRLSSLTRQEYEAVLTAEARKLDSEIQRANRLLTQLDGEEATPVIDARNEARAKLEAVATELSTLESTTATATVDALIGKGLVSAKGDLDEIDGGTFKASVDADDNGSIDSILDKLGNAPGGIGAAAGALSGPGGPLLAIGGALFAAGLHAANLATNVDTMATYFDESPEDVSALASVLQSTADIEAADLMDVIGNMKGVLEENPGFVTALGLTMDEVRENPMQAFIKAVQKIGEDGRISGEEMTMMMQIFGEEGARQVAALIAAVDGDLVGAIEDVPEAQILSEEEIEEAKEFKRAWSDAKTEFQGIALSLGQDILPLMTQAAEMAGVIASALPDPEDGTPFGGIAPASEWEELLNTINEEKVAALQELVGGSIELAKALDEMGDGAIDAMLGVEGTDAAIKALIKGVGEGAIKQDEFNAIMEDGVVTQEEVAAALEVGETWMDDFGVAVEQARQEVEDNTESNEDFAGALADTERQLQENVSALEDERDALRESADALEDKIDAQRSSTDAYYRLRSAERGATEASEAYNDILAEGQREGETYNQFLRRQEAALDDVVLSAQDVADAEVEVARQTAAASGNTLKNATAVDIQNGSLIRQARTLEGAERTALINHIARINGIPESAMTEIAAAIDAGDYDTAMYLLSQLSQTRVTSVVADVNDWAYQQAQAQLNLLTAPRSKLITPYIAPPTGHVKYAMASGGPSTPAGESIVVGEFGPEVVELPAGSTVHGAARSAEMMREGGRGPQTVNNYYTTVNVPRGTDARAVLKGERRYARIQGPT